MTFWTDCNTPNIKTQHANQQESEWSSFKRSSLHQAVNTCYCDIYMVTHVHTIWRISFHFTLSLESFTVTPTLTKSINTPCGLALFLLPVRYMCTILGPTISTISPQPKFKPSLTLLLLWILQQLNFSVPSDQSCPSWSAPLKISVSSCLPVPALPQVFETLLLSSTICQRQVSLQSC